MAQQFFPLLRYADAPAALAFLERAFGFQRGEVVENPEGTIAHAELSDGAGAVMIGSDRDDSPAGRRAGLGWIYVAVDDIDSHYERARGAGAEIVSEPFDTDYGSRDYQARDPEGNLWSFGTYRPS
jgi:uncharacterized glyoxalase superfamily protein PhnB